MTDFSKFSYLLLFLYSFTFASPPIFPPETAITPSPWILPAGDNIVHFEKHLLQAPRAKKSCERQSSVASLRFE